MISPAKIASKAHLSRFRSPVPLSFPDLEEAAIEAGANEVKPLTHEQNDDVPAGAAGAKFICERTDVATVSKWLAAHGWTVITSELGFVPKAVTKLTEAEQEEVGAFLYALDEHDDVHRVWAAVE